jgi:uncharacterized protein
MHLVAISIIFFACLDGLVWVRFHRLLRPLRRHRLWQSLLACAMVSSILFSAELSTGSSLVLRTHHLVPTIIPSTIFVWHFLVLPMTIALLGAELAFRFIRKIYERTRRDPPPPSQSPAAAMTSRRAFLTAAALSAPPIASAALGAAGVAQLGKFRIKRYDLLLKDFPAGLDGLTIAFVADVHAGIFSTQKMLDDIAEATNSLKADLILLGGDLVNISHADLSNALDMVKRLKAPFGPYMVQGNHDVLGGAQEFNDACAARGVPLLLNQVETIYPRGIPLQLLGIIWTETGIAQHDCVQSVLRQRDPEIFSILVAHHPHAWYPAANYGVRLVLAGHTHGGQIMLTKHIGAGPLRFRYWTGLYQDWEVGSKLIVSNGVGDWFPLRINAPAEIVHLTLHPET